MVIYGVYIVSKSGGLIFNHDHNVPKIETELTFNYPLDVKLIYENKKIVVSFGQRDGIMGKLILYFFLKKLCINCSLFLYATHSNFICLFINLFYWKNV